MLRVEVSRVRLFELVDSGLGTFTFPSARLRALQGASAAGDLVVLSVSPFSSLASAGAGAYAGLQQGAIVDDMFEQLRAALGGGGDAAAAPLQGFAAAFGSGFAGVSLGPYRLPAAPPALPAPAQWFSVPSAAAGLAAAALLTLVGAALIWRFWRLTRYLRLWRARAALRAVNWRELRSLTELQHSRYEAGVRAAGSANIAPLLAQLRYHYAACALALEEADATCDIARMWVDVTSTRNAGSAAGFRHQLAKSALNTSVRVQLARRHEQSNIQHLLLNAEAVLTGTDMLWACTTGAGVRAAAAEDARAAAEEGYVAQANSWLLLGRGGRVLSMRGIAAHASVDASDVPVAFACAPPAPL